MQWYVSPSCRLPDCQKDQLTPSTLTAEMTGCLDSSLYVTHRRSIVLAVVSTFQSVWERVLKGMTYYYSTYIRVDQVAGNTGHHCNPPSVRLSVRTSHELSRDVVAVGGCAEFCGNKMKGRSGLLRGLKGKLLEFGGKASA